MPSRCSTSSQAAQPSLCGSSPAQGRAPRAVSRGTVLYPTGTEYCNRAPLIFPNNLSQKCFASTTPNLNHGCVQKSAPRGEQKFLITVQKRETPRGSPATHRPEFLKGGTGAGSAPSLRWPCHQKNQSSDKPQVMKSITQ